MSMFTLRLIALISMLLDHIGYTVFPDLMWLRAIGRLSFPVFAFQLVEGYQHTRRKVQYLTRILIFAALSEIPFDLMVAGIPFSPARQNVMWSLSLGLILLFLIEKVQQTQTNLLVRRTTLFYIVCFFAILAEVQFLDYGGFGILQIFTFYILRQKSPYIQAVCVCIINLLMGGPTVHILGLDLPLQIFATSAIIPIACYSGNKGPTSLPWTWFCYLFYPAHMLLLSLLA